VRPTPPLLTSILARLEPTPEATVVREELLDVKLSHQMSGQRFLVAKSLTPMLDTSKLVTLVLQLVKQMKSHPERPFAQEESIA
jgi:hypothetical protein